jgi:hypothetical protein
MLIFHFTVIKELRLNFHLTINTIWCINSVAVLVLIAAACRATAAYRVRIIHYKIVEPGRSLVLKMKILTTILTGQHCSVIDENATFDIHDEIYSSALFSQAMSNLSNRWLTPYGIITMKIICAKESRIVCDVESCQHRLSGMHIGQRL